MKSGKKGPNTSLGAFSPQNAIAVAFGLLILQAATVGISDDEAYYWVLGQRPGWGFAYHPPAVAWLVAAAEKAFGFLRAVSAPLPIRLGTISLWLACMAIASRWIGSKKNPALLLLLPAFTGLAWMVVPDWPFLLGHLLALWGSWEWVKRGKRRGLALAALGLALALASKLTGLVTGLALGLVASQLRSKPRAMGALLGAAAVGACVGLIPTFVWNASHDWHAIRYQFLERHGGGDLSFVRWGRFWLAQLVLAGAGLLAAAPRLLRSEKSDAESRFIRTWALAGAVFLVQPLFSDFKAHWAVVFWLPLAMELCRREGEKEFRGFARVQAVFGAAVIALVSLTTHAPVITALTGDLRKDVASDLRGWRPWAREFKNPEALPVLGSRYQTAAQAAFALGSTQSVALLPRSPAESDEWPAVDLRRGYFYVANSRYDQPPPYSGVRCEPLPRFEERSGSAVVQWIAVWKCAPGLRPPG